MSQKTLIRSIALLLITLIGIGVFLIIALPKLNNGNTIQPMVELETEDTDNLYAEFHVPEFELVDRHGEPITHEVLDGQYTVVDFFFTSCPLWCPGMTQSMYQVQQATYGTDLRFMSISIDGDVDTPEAIDGYATRYRCDEERWDYATGDPEIVANLVKDGLKFDLGDPNDTEDAGRLINHPTRLILLGPDRRVVGLYRYDDPDAVDELIADALKLVQ
ncbi:MAG: SCO family protein [Phycisphaerales bacterium]